MPAVWISKVPRAGPYSPVAVDQHSTSKDPGNMLTCTSLEQWHCPEADNYQGLRVARSIDPNRWQSVADTLSTQMKGGSNDKIQQHIISLDEPEAVLYDKFQKAALASSRGFPPALANLVCEDAQALAIAMYKMVPKAQQLILKVELYGEAVCSRWHEDKYVCRSIVSYNCSATQYTANSNVNFDEMYYCGNNDHIIRDKSQILHADVGDIVMMKGSKFPGKAKSLVHKSPEVRYYDTECRDVQARILLKVDIQDMTGSEVKNSCDGD